MYEPFVIHGSSPVATVATLATLREPAAQPESEQEPKTVATVAPAITLAPRIGAEPPFGGLHPRYGPAFEALCAQCPAGVDCFAWSAAACDAAATLSFFGTELARLNWTSADLFAPNGLAWWLKGDAVVAIGPRRAFTQSRRVFERAPR